MKVMQVIPDLGVAGAEIMCENLVYELSKLGVDVSIVSLYSDHTPITDRLEKNGYKIHYLNKKRGLDLSIIFKLIKIFKNEKPDVIHTHRYVMQYTMPAAIICKIKKRIHTVHNVANKENNFMARKLNTIFYKFNKVIPVALSNEIKETILDEYHLNENSIPVIYNGIDLSKCIKKKNYDIKNVINITHIGRFSYQKNHTGIVNAFYEYHKEYKNSILNLIGDGSEKKSIIELVEKLGLSDCVNFWGIQKDVYSFLNKADIFILPSHYEGMPMTLIEAMGTGLPIISTNVGGVGDMLENNKEALLIKNDISELVSALCKLSNNTQVRKKLGEAALKKSNVFSAKVMAQKYLEIYQENN